MCYVLLYGTTLFDFMVYVFCSALAIVHFFFIISFSLFTLNETLNLSLYCPPFSLIAIMLSYTFAMNIMYTNPKEAIDSPFNLISVCCKTNESSVG
ncbi:hypothetical protein HanOQP8_Chr09g0309481 [Helianthus annuus]|nr:hypothetical protein HanOQP8_Chr09g0309481 [Helianthus annuus]